MSSGLPKDVRRIAIVVVIGAIMSILDATIVNVALQTLRTRPRRVAGDDPVGQHRLPAGAGRGDPAHRVDGRALRTAPRLDGRRRAFVATSVLCGAAWSADSLIAFRVLQGLAGGMIMPIGMITLAQAAGPKRMGRVMSVVGVPMLLGPVIGPVIGGLLVDNLCWRWIFYVNVPSARSAWCWPTGCCRGPRRRPRRRRASDAAAGPLGLLLLSPGVAAIVFGLSEVGTHRHADRAERVAADRRRRCDGRRVRAARAAHRRTRWWRSGCSADAASAPRRRRPACSAARCSAP